MSNIKTIVIDGKKIEYFAGKLPQVGDYGLYEGKIYKVVSSFSVGPKMTFGLENGDITIYYKPWKNKKKLHWITKR